MWYFAWILGLGLACSFGVLNAMWYEMRNDRLAQGAPGAGAVVSSPGPVQP
ncbi:cytochrome bd-I oxidase subunit CydX [Devosia sp.]|uniref:cytochrome bd-I oxidase subunit CydX n=1 Tax=Devosia sp. TaxID=1871048 RepID=UPI0032672CEE